MRRGYDPDLTWAPVERTAYAPVVTYPPQQPGGWPDQPPQGTPSQPPYPGDESSGPEQYTFDAGFPQSAPPQYEQPGYPPPGAAPMSGGPAGFPQSAPPGAAPMSGGPAGYPQGMPPGAPLPPKKRSPLPFLFAGGGALVVVLAIIAVVAVFSTGKDDEKTPQADTSHSARPSASSSPSGQPGDGVQGDMIVDSATGWGFTKGGSPWENTPTPTVSELDNPVGQSVELGDNFYATMQLGQLSSEFGYSGPDDLKSVKSDLATSILGNYYGDGAKVDTSQKHVDQKLTVQGHKVWLWSFEVKYKNDGASQGEYVVIAVLDAGGGKAGAFYGSVPDGHDSLKSQVIDSAGSLTIEP